MLLTPYHWVSDAQDKAATPRSALVGVAEIGPPGAERGRHQGYRLGLIRRLSSMGRPLGTGHTIRRRDTMARVRWRPVASCRPARAMQRVGAKPCRSREDGAVGCLFGRPRRIARLIRGSPGVSGPFRWLRRSSGVRDPGHHISGSHPFRPSLKRPKDAPRLRQVDRQLVLTRSTPGTARSGRKYDHPLWATRPLGHT